MDIFKNFSALFIEVWDRGILGVDILQIIIGLGIFLIFLLFRGFISKIIINRLKKIAKKTTNKLDDTFVQAMEGPARFFPIVIGFFIASYYLEFSPESQSFIDNLNKSWAPNATATPNKPNPAIIGPIFIPHNSKTAAAPKIRISILKALTIQPINSFVKSFSNPPNR